MDKMEFRPSFINLSIIVRFICIAILEYVIGSVFLLFNNPQYQQRLQYASIFSLIFLFILIFTPALMIFQYYKYINSVIDITGNDLIFSSKNLFGSVKIEKIDLQSVQQIDERKEVKIVGKAAIYVYWLIFKGKDIQTKEVFIFGFDEGMVKHMLYFLKGKHPNISINTHLYKDKDKQM